MIYDSRGMVKASLFEKVQLPPSTDDVEALAVACATSFAQVLGFFAMILEGYPR